MPKIKSHKGAQKRFGVTGSGKLIRVKAWRGHHLDIKSSRRTRRYAGKVVVDISNPVKADYSGLSLGHSTSAAEEIQKAAPEARIVKAFNTIFAGLFAASAAITSDVPVFVAGGDADAVGAVEKLVLTAGFRPENVGGLDGARLIEPVGMLNIRFGYGLGRGTAIARRRERRPPRGGGTG